MANVYCSTNSMIFDEKLVDNRDLYFMDSNLNPFNFKHGYPSIFVKLVCLNIRARSLKAKFRVSSWQLLVKKTRPRLWLHKVMVVI